MRKDRVTPELVATIRIRDGECIPALLGAPGGCRDQWGSPIPLRGRYAPSHLQVMHVKEQPRLGVRAPSDPAHCVLGCDFHHDGWGTSRAGLAELRAYLREAT